MHSVVAPAPPRKQKKKDEDPKTKKNKSNSKKRAALVCLRGNVRVSRRNVSIVPPVRAFMLLGACAHFAKYCIPVSLRA